MDEPAANGIDLEGMRRHNTAATLRALHQGRDLTLGQLTHATGLSRRTVEKIIASFVDLQWAVERRPSGTASAGRPARSFAFVASAKVALSIYFARDQVELSVCDLYGTSLGRWSEIVSAKAGLETRMSAARGLARQAFANIGIGRERVGAVVIAASGVVHDNGSVDIGPLLGHSLSTGLDIGLYDLAGKLRSEFPCPIFIENDAKLAAIGEAWRGAAAGCQNFACYYTYGPWVGVGIVIDGTIHRGVDGRAGEVLWADAFERQAIAENPISHLGSPDLVRAAKAASIVESARNNDPDALDQIRNYARLMAPGIGAMVWLLAPEAIVIGGTLANAGDLLLPMLSEFVTLRVPPKTRLLASDLGTSAVSLGALRTALDRIEESFADLVVAS
ncbi:ROK family protein [Arthrobacter sp. S2(2024)]|uniref:ROK family protein n=1 Tax=Arthrobacter sp. S2(2024) TaxID=3111911 RepID=UPI002FC7A0BD